MFLGLMISLSIGYSLNWNSDDALRLFVFSGFSLNFDSTSLQQPKANSYQNQETRIVSPVNWPNRHLALLRTSYNLKLFESSINKTEKACWLLAF